MFTVVRVIGTLFYLGFLLAPLAALVVVGVTAAVVSPRRAWAWLAALAGVSTVLWLAYAGLFQHDTTCGRGYSRCPTVYGYEAPLPDQHGAGWALLVAGFVLPAAWAGWRRLAPALTVGAVLAVGPTAVAWWTAPRGDNDGLWALYFWYLAGLGVLAAGVTFVVEGLRLYLDARRRPRHDLDGPPPPE